jgi:hypothetical protein
MPHRSDHSTLDELGLVKSLSMRPLAASQMVRPAHGTSHQADRLPAEEGNRRDIPSEKRIGIIADQGDILRGRDAAAGEVLLRSGEK